MTVEFATTVAPAWEADGRPEWLPPSLGSRGVDVLSVGDEISNLIGLNN